jgi:hypothetical protein
MRPEREILKDKADLSLVWSYKRASVFGNQLAVDPDLTGIAVLKTRDEAQ